MKHLHLFHKYFPSERGREIVLTHSALVAEKALAVAKSLDDHTLDIAFIAEAALLHDIGVCRTHAPGFGCAGGEPYIRHGILGRQILEQEGLPWHALVCERHIGVGLTVSDIVSQKLPLPHREMAPLSREERIICFADLFYSKSPGRVAEEKPVAEIRQGLSRFGEEKVGIFDGWLVEFTPPHSPQLL